MRYKTIDATLAGALGAEISCVALSDNPNDDASFQPTKITSLSPHAMLCSNHHDHERNYEIQALSGRKNKPIAEGPTKKRR